MSELIDSLDNHLAPGIEIDQACIPMGMLLAWAVNLQLIHPSLVQDHEQLVLRIRYGEISGTQLLVACGGDLRRDMFQPAAGAFVDRHYSAYLEEFARLFPEPPADNQDSYAKVASWLTKTYMSTRGVRKPGGESPGVLSWLRKKFGVNKT
ncbi:MAG: hypothetical protein AAF541_00415 [Pseudomonadota bacterium]